MHIFSRYALSAVLLIFLTSGIFSTNGSGLGVQLGNAWTDKSRYNPGELVTVTVETSGSGQVEFSLVRLGNVIDHSTIFAAGEEEVSWTFTPPTDDFTGYFIHIDTEASSAQTAIDVSSTWNRFPRLGYLDLYDVNMMPAEYTETVEQLSRDYHLNALQFYDWMWRHEEPVQLDANGDLVDTWTAWNGDVIAPETVIGLIDAAHLINVAALPYSMSYAALQGFEENGVNADWRLRYRNGGTDWKFEMLPNEPDTTLWIMNPENQEWVNHIAAQYLKQINLLGFDGTHIDQLGNWGGSSDGGMDDISGSPVDIPKGFDNIVSTTKNFNAVDGFAGDWLAGGESDYLYTELWENHESYAQVQNYLATQRESSGGKSAVVAAYLNYRSNPGEIYEAEDGELAGGVEIDNDHPGYTGTGFVDQFGQIGDSVTITVTATENRRYGIVPRWSNGTGATATRTVIVDGINIGHIKLSPTANWDTWSVEGGTAVYLSEGNHTVTLALDGDDMGYVNLDSITLSSFNTPSVQLANSAFAANGTSHIEMGQGNQMLVAPYFPDKTKQIQSWMKTYYDVLTGYENLFFGSNLYSLNNTVSIDGYSTSRNGAANTIWANVMRNDGIDIIHFINLIENNEEWRDPANNPPALSGLSVTYYLGDAPVPDSIHAASPDRNGGRSSEIAFTSGIDENGTYISFILPELNNWDFLYFGKSIVGNGNIVTKANRCLDVADAASVSGSNIQLWDCASSATQEWIYNSEKLFALGKCLEPVGQGIENGTLLYLSDCSDDIPSQRWVRTGKSQYLNTASGRCLDVVGGYTDNGTLAHLWDCHAGASQKWTMPR